MKKYYKGMLLVLCTVLSLGLAIPQPSMAGIPGTQLPTGGFPMGEANCVNNAGQCAGYLRDSSNAWHACFWDFGTLTPTLLDQADDGVLDDCTETTATCINSDGEVAGTGWYDTGDGGNWYQHGFLWTEGGGMVDIGTLLDGDGWTEAVDINDLGQVLAVSYDDNVDRNFLWSAGTRTELTYTYSFATYPIDIGNHSINNSGQVAGYVADWTLGYPAVLWENEATTILTPGINASGRKYINNAGQVAGIQNGGGINPWIYTPGEGLRFIDVTGHYPDLSNDGTIYVGGLNDQGQVLISQSSPVICAMVWEDNGSGGDVFTDIPVSCLIKSDTETLFVKLLNDQGQVIVGEYSAAGARLRNFFWDPATPDGIALLAPLPGTQKTEVYGLNDSGLAVGQSYDASYTTALPCIWQTDGIAMTYPPVLDASAAPATGLVGSNISFRATATDPDAGDTLSFSLDPDAPAGATIDSSTGDFSWTPAAAGQVTFTIRVADSEDLCDTAKLTIDVARPSALPLTVQSVARNGKSVVVWVLIENPTAADVADVAVTAASLGGVNTNTRLPITTKKIRAGSSTKCQFKFAGDAVPAGEAAFNAEGTCSLGGFDTTETVTVP